VIDSENDECNSEDERTFMHETYKGWNTHQTQTDKNKMCVDVERKKTAGKSRKGGKPDNQLSPTFRKTSMPSIRVWWI
jgi:hypothetical protein